MTIATSSNGRCSWRLYRNAAMTGQAPGGGVARARQAGDSLEVSRSRMEPPAAGATVAFTGIAYPNVGTGIAYPEPAVTARIAWVSCPQLPRPREDGRRVGALRAADFRVTAYTSSKPLRQMIFHVLTL